VLLLRGHLHREPFASWSDPGEVLRESLSREDLRATSDAAHWRETHLIPVIDNPQSSPMFQRRSSASMMRSASSA